MIAPSPTGPAVNNRPVAFTPLQRTLLTLLCCADCMVVLDFSIVNVAIPSIQTSLGFFPADVQWLFTGYGLVFGGFLLLGGRLSDLFGRKRIFMIGTVIFTLASLLGGFSVNPAMLVALRGMQGLGAALLAPAALALLMGVFEEGPARNRAFGIWGTVAAAGYSIGVVLGGVLTAWVGWRAILFVNVPLGLGILYFAMRMLRESEAPTVKPKLDLLGSVLVTSGLMALVYALAKAPEAGWGSGSTWRLLATAGALLTAFVVVEARGKQPLMPLRIFRLPGIAAANLICTLMSAGMIAMNLLLTLHFQQVLKFTPLVTGLAFLPHGLAATYAGPWGGRLANRWGARLVLIGGLIVSLVCMGLLALISTQNSFWFHILPVTILMSFGIMPAFVTLTLLATSGATPKDHGLVSGIVNTTGQLGGSIGLAVLIAVAAGRSMKLRSLGLVSEAEALISGYRMALGAATVLLAVALIIAWLGLHKRDTAT